MVKNNFHQFILLEWDENQEIPSKRAVIFFLCVG